MAEKKVVWHSKAKSSFENYIKKIEEESIQGAENVRDAINLALAQLPRFPERYPLDKFRKSNDGTFRAFEEKNYRINYHITDTEIIILRIRHVKQKPKYY